MIRTAFLTSIVLAFAIGTSTSAQTAGLFEVRFDLSNLTAQQQTDLEPALAETKRFWESVIVGYHPDPAAASRLFQNSNWQTPRRSTTHVESVDAPNSVTRSVCQDKKS